MRTYKDKYLVIEMRNKLRPLSLMICGDRRVDSDPNAMSKWRRPDMWTGKILVLPELWGRTATATHIMQSTPHDLVLFLGNYLDYNSVYASDSPTVPDSTKERLARDIRWLSNLLLENKLQERKMSHPKYVFLLGRYESEHFVFNIHRPHSALRFTYSDKWNIIHDLYNQILVYDNLEKTRVLSAGHRKPVLPLIKICGADGDEADGGYLKLLVNSLIHDNTTVDMAFSFSYMSLFFEYFILRLYNLSKNYETTVLVTPAGITRRMDMGVSLVRESTVKRYYGQFLNTAVAKAVRHANSLLEKGIIPNLYGRAARDKGIFLVGGLWWCDVVLDFEPIPFAIQLFGQTSGLSKPHYYNDKSSIIISDTDNKVSINPLGNSYEIGKLARETPYGFNMRMVSPVSSYHTMNYALIVEDTIEFRQTQTLPEDIQ